MGSQIEGKMKSEFGMEIIRIENKDRQIYYDFCRIIFYKEGGSVICADKGARRKNFS
jgi:hypothetical protein